MASAVDNLLIVVNVLVALAIVIALVGVTNTLALSVFERTREIGLTRAVGGTRRQVRIEFDPLQLAARNLTPTELIPSLKQANNQLYTGQIESLDRARVR